MKKWGQELENEQGSVHERIGIGREKWYTYVIMLKIKEKLCRNVKVSNQPSGTISHDLEIESLNYEYSHHIKDLLLNIIILVYIKLAERNLPNLLIFLGVNCIL